MQYLFVIFCGRAVIVAISLFADFSANSHGAADILAFPDSMFNLTLILCGVQARMSRGNNPSLNLLLNEHYATYTDKALRQEYVRVFNKQPAGLDRQRVLVALIKDARKQMDIPASGSATGTAPAGSQHLCFATSAPNSCFSLVFRSSSSNITVECVAPCG